MKLEIFLERNSKNTQISNFMKILPVGAELFSRRTDRRTDMTKLIVAFHNFANTLKNCTGKSYVYWIVHHCDSWRIRDQLDVTIYKVLFHLFYDQQVSDINTFIIRSLRHFYCITTLVVCSCFDVCWKFGVAGWGGIRVAGWSCASACLRKWMTHWLID